MTGRIEAGRLVPARLFPNLPAPSRGHFGRRHVAPGRKRYLEYVRKAAARTKRVREFDSVIQADKVFPAPRVVIVPPVVTTVEPPALPPIPFGGPWEALPYWKGETVFVVASGPSIASVDFDRLRGRKIICTNSSYERVPFCDFIFFGDGRWWEAHKAALVGFKGHIVTVSGVAKSKRLLRLKRIKPTSPATGFAAARDSLASQRTSTQGSLNLAAHLGAAKIGLIGADMKRADDGRSHGHTPHKWPSRPGNVTWDEQLRVLKWIERPLQVRGVKVFNLSPESRIPWWPKMTLDEFLKRESVL